MPTSNVQATHVETVSPLCVEVITFNRVTAALEQCAQEAATSRRADATQQRERHGRLCDAVHQNSRLWIAILDDLVSPDNRLPQDMKQRVASLGAASLTHGRKILAGQATLQLLIDINRAIMIGLSKMPDGRCSQAPIDSEVGYARSKA